MLWFFGVNNMSIVISSLPNVVFSHIYKADSYKNNFNSRRNFLEISYVYEGSVCIRVNNEIFYANQGDVICLLSDRNTSIIAEGYHCHHTVGVSVIWNDIDKNENGLLLPLTTPSFYNTKKICRLIDDMINRQLFYRSNKMQGIAKWFELVCEIDNCNRKIQSFSSPGEQRYVNAVKTYLQENIYLPITQKDVAKYLGITSEYLCSVFKKVEGVTVMHYINKTKLEAIKTVMDNTDLHLYEAAAMYGYNDPNYVSRLYKKIFGHNITDKLLIYPEIKST